METSLRKKKPLKPKKSELPLSFQYIERRGVKITSWEERIRQTRRITLLVGLLDLESHSVTLRVVHYWKIYDISGTAGDSTRGTNNLHWLKSLLRLAFFFGKSSLKED